MSQFSNDDQISRFSIDAEKTVTNLEMATTKGYDTEFLQTKNIPNLTNLSTVGYSPNQTSPYKPLPHIKQNLADILGVKDMIQSQLEEHQQMAHLKQLYLSLENNTKKLKSNLFKIDQLQQNNDFNPSNQPNSLNLNLNLNKTDKNHFNKKTSRSMTMHHKFESHFLSPKSV